MTKIKPVAETVFPWLKNNGYSLAPLTGTDTAALRAAVQVIDLYSHAPSRELLAAFGSIVDCMQPSTVSMAYDSIAHVLDWSDRERLWKLAALGPTPAGVLIR